MSWIYQNKEFTPDDIPEGAHGFVYLMTVELDGKRYGYIGKKAFYSNTKVPLGKKEMPTDRRLKKTKIRKSLGYLKYYSSNDILKKAAKDGIPIKRIILHICDTARELTYYEVKYQFKCDVLESEAYLNDSILGTFYKYGSQGLNKAGARTIESVESKTL